MDAFRFAVIGDTHYCLPDRRPSLRRSLAFDRMPDFQRYAWMRPTLERLVDAMAAERPALLVSTGDLIEGGGDDDAEMRGVSALLGRAAPEFHWAPGTHDPRVPGNAPAYQAFTREGCRFILLDYIGWDATQRDWFANELAGTDDARRAFVFAHPPLYLLGRHFFDSPRFRRDVAALLAERPVDVYFCGHTHNQSLSRHGGMVQAKGSAVGYPDAEAVPLGDLHAIPPDTAEHRYFWGIAEDHAPAFFLIDVDGEATTLTWRSLSGASALRIDRRFASPRVVSYPPLRKDERRLDPVDRNQVKSGWLNAFAADRRNGLKPTPPAEDDVRLWLNGVDLGPMPYNASYAARRYLTLPETALLSVDRENTLRLRMPGASPFAAGSFSLELSLLDGRIVRSAPSTELFFRGESPDFEYAAPRARRTEAGETVDIPIAFEA